MKKVGIYGSMIDKLYYSETLVSLNRNNETGDFEIEVLKDRYGHNKGVQTLEESIDLFINILVLLKFNESNKLFQETVRSKLEETMKKILIDNDLPEDKEKGEE